jgi:hypothetical protein
MTCSEEISWHLPRELKESHEYPSQNKRSQCHNLNPGPPVQDLFGCNFAFACFNEGRAVYSMGLRHMSVYSMKSKSAMPAFMKNGMVHSLNVVCYDRNMSGFEQHVTSIRK